MQFCQIKNTERAGHFAKLAVGQMAQITVQEPEFTDHRQPEIACGRPQMLALLGIPAGIQPEIPAPKSETCCISDSNIPNFNAILHVSF